MSRRGPKPKPTAIKRLRGNPGKRGLPVSEPVLEQAGRLAPEWLKGPALEKWLAEVDALVDAGVLTVGDRDVFAAYCVKWVQWRHLEAALSNSTDLIRTPGGMPIANPYFHMANRVFDQVVKLEAELGLTPSSRSRVKAPGKAKDGGHWERFK